MIKIKILDEFHYQSFPIVEDMIEVEDDVIVEIGKTKKFDIEKNTVVDYDNSKELEEKELALLRKRRETECFSVINRGKLWYNKLTIEQEYELADWYDAWLNVTETKEVPQRPSFVDEKLENNIILGVI